MWIPILLRFYRNWVKRSNPISLSICAIILLLMWISVAGAWDLTGQISRAAIPYVTTTGSLAIAMYAHLTFYWARKKFDSSRRDTE